MLNAATGCWKTCCITLTEVEVGCVFWVADGNTVLFPVHCIQCGSYLSFHDFWHTLVRKNSSLSAYSAALNLQSSVFYFRQPSWGSSPDCLGHKMSIWTWCAFLPIPPLVRHVWPTGSYQNISPHLHWRPAFTTTSIPFIAESYPKVTANFQETVLFKLATPLMSMSYCLGL